MFTEASRSGVEPEWTSYSGGRDDDSVQHHVELSQDEAQEYVRDMVDVLDATSSRRFDALALDWGVVQSTAEKRLNALEDMGVTEHLEDGCYGSNTLVIHITRFQRPTSLEPLSVLLPDRTRL